MADQDEADDNDSADGPSRKDFWDKLRASGTIVVAIVVAAMGGWFNHQQAERNRVSSETQFYTSLLAQRERSDSELRTEMFKTLFEAYFRGRLTAGSVPSTPAPAGNGFAAAAGPGGAATPDFTALEQRTMFLDVLARNFENIDIRPLFEDLDRRLTEIVWSGDRGGGGVSEAQRRGFRLRWQLRRAALGNVSRQVSALTALEGARVERLRVTDGTCSALAGDAPERSDGIDEPRIFGFGTILIGRLDDGTVALSLLLDGDPGTGGEATQPQRLDFQVTFFDMPVLENIRLPTGERLALTLEGYFSPKEYAPFVGEIPDQSARFDYRSFVDHAELRGCRTAWLTLVLFPDTYIGPRDRPFIENLIETKL